MVLLNGFANMGGGVVIKWGVGTFPKFANMGVLIIWGGGWIDAIIYTNILVELC